MQDPETKIYELIHGCGGCADAAAIDTVFVLVNPYEIDILQKNRIRVNKIEFYQHKQYSQWYSYGDIIDFYKKKYAYATDKPTIYLLGGSAYYGAKPVENVQIENIHIWPEFNCLKYIANYSAEIVGFTDASADDNDKFVRLLKTNHMNSLFYSSDNTGIIGVEGYFPFYEKFYQYLDTITNIYIINRANDDFGAFVEKNHKHKVKYLKINVAKLFYTNPELIAYYRSRTDFNHNNYIHTYYGFDRRYTVIDENIIIGNDTYTYISRAVSQGQENWFPLDVTHIINVSDEDIDPRYLPNVFYYYYPINEREKDQTVTKCALLAAVDRLRELIETNKKVFIHCSIGMNRSPAVVLMYLIKYRNMSLFSAYEHICTKRFIYTSYDLFDIIYNEACSIVANVPKRMGYSQGIGLALFSFWSKFYGGSTNRSEIEISRSDSVVKWNLENRVISPLKLRTNYANNFSENGAHMFALYDLLHIRRIISSEK